jgi:integrase
MIAAGVNAKALSTFMGHANISITLDRYGHFDAWVQGGGGGPPRRHLADQRKRSERNQDRRAA